MRNLSQLVDGYPCEMNLEFLGIRGVNFHSVFRLGIPNYNNSGPKNPETPRNSKFIANRTWNSNSEHQ